jgi:3-carboxy-cis,cis-muconate cycloisomerase
MAQNVGAAGELIMAEALMMHLAPTIGRDHAHEVVYKASELVRRQGVTLEEAARLTAAEAGYHEVSLPAAKLVPEAYLGEAEDVVDYAIDAWRNRAHGANCVRQ